LCFQTEAKCFPLFDEWSVSDVTRYCLQLSYLAMTKKFFSLL
jgi:hypothetical protein